VAVVGIPNAFIQTTIKEEDDKAIIKLCDVLVDIAPKVAYTPFVTTPSRVADR
jgi:hypothetical protein